MMYDNWLEEKFGEKKRRLKRKSEERKINSSKTSVEFHQRYMDLIIERGIEQRRKKEVKNAVVC